jgi:hypothetical protein
VELTAGLVLGNVIGGEKGQRLDAAIRRSWLVNLNRVLASFEALRELAGRRGVSLSEALREAAIRLLEADEAASKTVSSSWQVVSVPTVTTSSTTSKDVSAVS